MRKILMVAVFIAFAIPNITSNVLRDKLEFGIACQKCKPYPDWK